MCNHWPLLILSIEKCVVISWNLWDTRSPARFPFIARYRSYHINVRSHDLDDDRNVTSYLLPRPDINPSEYKDAEGHCHPTIELLVGFLNPPLACLTKAPTMHISHILPFVAGLAAAIPESLTSAAADPDLQLAGIAYGGSGCSAGSVSVKPSADLSKLSLHYDFMAAQSGQNIPVSSTRRNCQVNVKFKYSSGWQFSVSKAEYSGYAQIPAGLTGLSKSTYYFSGESSQVRVFSLICGSTYLVLTSIPLGLFEYNHQRTVRRHLPQDGRVGRDPDCMVPLRPRGHAEHQLRGPAVACRHWPECDANARRPGKPPRHVATLRSCGPCPRDPGRPQPIAP